MPIINEIRDSVVGYLDGGAIREWIPPIGIDLNTGNVNIRAQMGDCTDKATNTTRFPVECLASLLILTGISDGPYIAQINIYDNLGKYIRGLKQAFGYCGELMNPARVTEGGFIMNDLVWNLKDSGGNEVGSGAYIWKVTLNFAKKNSKVRVFKMGIVRKLYPAPGACFGGNP